MKVQNARDEAQAALRQAHRATKQGNLKEAERWSKVAERLADSADKLARAPQQEEEDVEAIRAEIRRRIAKLIEADQANDLWEAQCAQHEIETARCLREGIEPPPPMPLMPYSDKALERIVTEPWNDGVKPPRAL